MTPSGANQPVPSLPVPLEVYTVPGPIVSVYLRTEGALPHAADEVAARWKAARAQLADAGAPEAALAAIDPTIEGAHAVGQTLVALSNAHGLVYLAHLPKLIDRDLALVGRLPRLVPLLAATQELLPYVVVVTDRVGAELVAVLPDQPDRQIAVAGNELHVTRSAPGGWSQRRFQQRAENRWEANAREVADALTRLVDSSYPRLVIISGDVRAVQFLREQVPSRVGALLAEVQGEYSNLDEALRRSDELIEAAAAEDIAALLADYRREHESGGLGIAGANATLDALHAGQVGTLLVEPQPLVELQQEAQTHDGGQEGKGVPPAWCGPELAQVSATAQSLRAAGVADPKPVPLADAAIRAAAGTGAVVRIVPTGALKSGPGGIAALLRYR